LADRRRAETERRLNLAERGRTHCHAVKDTTPNCHLRFPGRSVPSEAADEQPLDPNRGVALHYAVGVLK
ncbi:hypothetical protein fugu_002662, partial [Takifugu bimaculatus]